MRLDPSAAEKISKRSEAQLDKVTEEYIFGKATHEQLLDAERDYGVDYESATLELSGVFRQANVKFKKLLAFLKQ
jgi:hypothetical protein